MPALFFSGHRVQCGATNGIHPQSSFRASACFVCLCVFLSPLLLINIIVILTPTRMTFSLYQLCYRKAFMLENCQGNMVLLLRSSKSMTFSYLLLLMVFLPLDLCCTFSFFTVLVTVCSVFQKITQCKFPQRLVSRKSDLFILA